MNMCVLAFGERDREIAIKPPASQFQKQLTGQVAIQMLKVLRTAARESDQTRQDRLKRVKWGKLAVKAVKQVQDQPGKEIKFRKKAAKLAGKQPEQMGQTEKAGEKIHLITDRVPIDSRDSAPLENPPKNPVKTGRKRKTDNPPEGSVPK